MLFDDLGMAADHPPEVSAELRVAPTTTGKGFNVLRLPLIPLACWRVDEFWFDFDSSFLRPESATAFPLLHLLRVAHPGALLSVFGHADPTGDDAYNKRLAGRRALAVYAALVRDTARWEDLYSKPEGADDWGVRTLQILLRRTGHDPGPADGTAGKRTKAAVESFQKSAGLTVDGKPGPKTREKLFRAYMDFLCIDEHKQPQVLQASEFLARGADAGGKGDVQGCGEFNPLLIFSRDEQKRFANPANKDERDARNGPNRRVVIFLFRPGTEISIAHWPCPRASEGDAGCRKRFWSDGEMRRSPSATSRKFQDTHDTFGCRFYHRLAISSPCEQYEIRDFLRIEDELGDAVINTPIQCLMSDGSNISMTTDGNGMILVSGKRLVRIEMDDIHKLENG